MSSGEPSGGVGGARGVRGGLAPLSEGGASVRLGGDELAMGIWSLEVGGGFVVLRRCL